MIHQTFRLNNTWDDFHLDLDKMKVILQKKTTKQKNKNEYPPKIIDRSVNKCLNKKIVHNPSEAEPSKAKENI